MIGKTIGPYQILAELGRGGMGEVYRATDSHLKRAVAIKVLPAAMAADADRLMRFQREAEVLAALNHPNIAAIYGLEKTPDLTALVMELVEGQDLSELIDGTSAGAKAPALHLQDALAIARQIADALEAAHEQGIVHRDLKPQNIKVRADGTVKVLDFGLAKAMDSPGAEAPGLRRDSNNSPTMTSPAMTAMGMILGTAAYMSPEQAKGRAVDRRADIWAFGVVLYEMLTGARLFEAEDVSETLAAVLTRDVSRPSLPANIPPQLRALVRDCLIRDPRQRLRDVGEARRVIDRVMSGAPDELSAASSAPERPRRTRGWVWAAVGLVALAAVVTVAVPLTRPTPPEQPTVQFTVSPPNGVSFAMAPQLSPDGRKLAYVGEQAGKRLLYVHTFESATAQAIAGTEGIEVEVPAWSPDSQAIAFRADRKLKRVPASGGLVELICPLTGDLPGGVTWGSDDVLLLGQAGGPIRRVPAGGGAPEPLFTLDASNQEVSHLFPEFLPDRRHFFFLARSNGVFSTIVGSLDSKERRPLPGITASPRYAAPGYVLFIRERVLMAQRFDLERLELIGAPFSIAEGVSPGALSLWGGMTASSTGTIGYRVMPPASSRLVWFDRRGQRLEDVSPVGTYADFELSLDDRWVAYEMGQPGDIWALDLRNGIPQRVTSDPKREADPAWSPNSKTIAFRSDQDNGHMHARDVGAGGTDTVLLKGDARDSPASWSRDGKYLAYESGGHIWALPVTGEAKPIRVTEPLPGVSPAGTQISPDGQWVAYSSRELGDEQVFVQSFPQPGKKQRVSSAGGSGPRWSHDGKELFYMAPTRMLMAVKIDVAAGSLSAGPPVPVFALPSGDRKGYAVSAAGRFLLSVPEDDGTQSPFTVILNWAGGLKK